MNPDITKQLPLTSAMFQLPRVPVTASDADYGNRVFSEFAGSFPKVAEPLITLKIPPDYIEMLTRAFLNYASTDRISPSVVIKDANKMFAIAGSDFAVKGSRQEIAIARYLALLEGRETPALSRFLSGLGRIAGDRMAALPENYFGEFPQPLKSNGIWLDLATGFNFDPKYVCKIPNAKYIVVERSTMAAAYLNRIAELRGVKNLTVLKQDIRSLDFAPESIDTIRCKNVAHYVPHFDKLFADICNWISKEGRLVLQMDPKSNQHVSTLRELAEPITKLIFEQHWRFSYSFAEPNNEQGRVYDTLILTKPTNLQRIFGSAESARSMEAIKKYLEEITHKMKELRQSD